MIISRGNFFRKGDPAGPKPNPYQLTEDTTVTGGNFILCRVVTNGFILDLQGGNVRGLYIDGVKQDAYVWQRFEPLALATDILAAADQAGGEDATLAWLWSCEWLIANPAATYAEWQEAYITWADAEGNLVYSQALFVRLRDKFFPGQSFNQVRDTITAETLGTWQGDATQLAEEYS